jgi:hypothetical protein
MRALPWGIAVVGSAFVVFAASSVSSSLPLEPRLAYSVAFAAVSIELVLVARLSFSTTAPVTLAAGLATLISLWSLRALQVSPVTAALLTCVLLAGVTLLGAAIGGRIQAPGHLLAVFGISSLADLWSVFDPEGPSAKLAVHAATQPEKLVVLALPWPMLGSDRIEAIIGAGDILFAALYLAALAQHGLAATRAAWLMLGGLLIGLCGLLILERAIPLLPLMGAAVMIAEPKARSLSARERRSVALVLAALAVVIGYRLSR